jgi:DNA-binding CsgD family transcriptional regulator
MKAVEHLKTLCCLGLAPEAAMVAVTPLLHEIIPHGWTRMGLVEPDATIGTDFPENPAASGHFREHLWRFMDDPSALVSLWIPAFRAVGIGWTLPMQGPSYLESAYYREVERPLDSCWILDAMIGADGRSIGFLHLTRPRRARPFGVVEVQRLEQLRPWLAHAFLQRPPSRAFEALPEIYAATGVPIQSAQLILTDDCKIVYQTPGFEFLLRILAGEPANYTRFTPARDNLPAPIAKLFRMITATVNGTARHPPRLSLTTSYGMIDLEAKWLAPGHAPCDALTDPKGCLVAVTIELREHAVSRAARVLRESGATPAQVKVGIELAMGRSKREIAHKLGIRECSVGDQTKKLYRCLEVHNAVELGMKVWLERARPGMPSEIPAVSNPKGTTSNRPFHFPFGGARTPDCMPSSEH